MLNKKAVRAASRSALLVGNGGRVPAILECAGGLVNTKIVYVLSSVGEGIGTKSARDAGIEPGLIKWEDFKNEKSGREIFSKKVVAALRERNVDFIVMAGWRVLMPPSFIKEFGGSVVNIHPSILPAHPGNGETAICAQWENRAKPAGCTLHYIDEGMDTGEIIARGFVNVSDCGSKEELARAIHKKEEEILCEFLKSI